MLLSAINTAPLSAHRLLNFRITQFIQLKANKSNTTVFYKFENIARKTRLWTRNTNGFTNFLQKNLWRNFHSKQ